jgi:hypothetical protein
VAGSLPKILYTEKVSKNSRFNYLEDKAPALPEKLSSGRGHQMEPENQQTTEEPAFEVVEKEEQEEDQEEEDKKEEKEEFVREITATDHINKFMMSSFKDMLDSGKFVFPEGVTAEKQDDDEF